MFKAGDWVFNNIDGRIIKASKDFDPNSEDIWWHKWQPEQGEWCWFWNNNKQPFLAQLEQIDDDNSYLTIQGLHGSYDDLSDACYNFSFCEPFIGQLPSAYSL